MVKKFENFIQFASEMGHDYQPLANDRLKMFCGLAVTLHQGCGCTKAARTEQAMREYVSLGEYLDEGALAVIRAKYPNHRIEFAQDGPVFFVIEAI